MNSTERELKRLTWFVICLAVSALVGGGLLVWAVVRLSADR